MLGKDILAEEEKTHTRLLPDLEARLLAPDLTVFAFNEKFRERDYFVATKTTKKAVVLHFTAGFLWGDIDTLTRENFDVSVSYVVARNGRVYELFSPEHWSYHLGPGTVGGNEHCSSRRSASRSRMSGLLPYLEARSASAARNTATGPI
jgi:hypothetical protein